MLKLHCQGFRPMQTDVRVKMKGKAAEQQSRKARKLDCVI